MREVIEKPIYYVYVLLDPRKAGTFTYGEYKFEYEPFYVGKGSGVRKRMHAQHWSQVYNTHKGRKVNKIMRITGEYPPTKIIKEGMYEADAFRLEMEIIKSVGRDDLATGPLTNKSDGGEGQSGWIPDEETRKKLSAAGKGRKQTEKMRKIFQEMIHRPKSEEHKRKIGLRHKGKKIKPEHIEALRQRMLKFRHTEEHKKRVSEWAKGNQYCKGKQNAALDFAVRLPDGSTVITHCLVNFCKTAVGNPSNGSLKNGSCSKGYYAIRLEKFKEVGEDWNRALSVIKEKVDHLNSLRILRHSREREQRGEQ